MVFAFSRDGAVPGHALWRKLNKHRTPTWAVLFVVVLSLIITIPALFGNKAGFPVAFFAVTSITTIGLYIAYILPVFLRWRMGDKFEPGVWNLGKHYKMDQRHRHGLGRDLRGHFLSADGPAAVPWDSGFNWDDFNYAPLVTIALALGSGSPGWPVPRIRSRAR